MVESALWQQPLHFLGTGAFIPNQVQQKGLETLEWKFYTEINFIYLIIFDNNISCYYSFYRKNPRPI